MVSTFLTTAGTTLLAMGAWWFLLSLDGRTLIAHCGTAIKATPPELLPGFLSTPGPCLP